MLYTSLSMTRFLCCHPNSDPAIQILEIAELHASETLASCCYMHNTYFGGIAGQFTKPIVRSVTLCYYVKHLELDLLWAHGSDGPISRWRLQSMY